MENKNNSRRSFLRSAAKGAVVAVVTPTTFAMGEPANTIHSSIIGANDRIRVAILGLNGRGKIKCRSSSTMRSRHGCTE